MTVVAAVDDAEGRTRIAEEGDKLARALDTDLRVIHVLTEPEAVDLERANIQDVGEPLTAEDIEEIGATIARESSESLTESTQYVGIRGDPAVEITQYCKDQDAEYVVIGGKKRSPVGKVVFGSVTQSVLLNSPCPVLSILDGE